MTAYDQCRRLFFLRYVRRVEWPAPLTDRPGEWEAAIQRGLTFHQLVLQESLGMAVEEGVAKGEDALLNEWWQNWCAHKPQAPVGEVYSEMMLSVPMAGQRLVAKFNGCWSLMAKPGYSTGRRAAKSPSRSIGTVN